MLKHVSAIVFAFAVSASVVQAGESASVQQSDIAGSSYVLLQVDGEDFVADPRPMVEFGDNLEIRGKICNGFRGVATLNDGVLRAERVISTRMLCIHNDLSALESRFLRLLSSGAEITRDGDRLVMKGDDAELIFQRMAEEPADLAETLIGKKFILHQVNGEDFRVDRQPFIEFGEGNRVHGSACNSFMGVGEVKDGVLRVENAAATMMMCVDPKLSQFERDFHALLREGASITLADGGMLTLEGNGLKLVYRQET